FTPAELRRFRWVETNEMGAILRLALRWLLIAPRHFTENFVAEFCQGRIVLFQFGAGVDPIVLRVVLAVVVEPILHALGPIFRRSGAGVSALPFSGVGSALVGLAQVIRER